MQNIVRKLRPAQTEVHEAAHSQDLIEAPKRAQLDRATEGKTLDLPKIEQTDAAKE